MTREVKMSRRRLINITNTNPKYQKEVETRKSNLSLK
jgi:hypothetical protein